MNVTLMGVLLLIFAIAACAAPASPDIGAIQTVAAQTVIAQIAAQPAPQSPQPKPKEIGTPEQPLPKAMFAPGQTPGVQPQAKGTGSPQGKPQAGAQGGPYLHHIESATSTDGLNWTNDGKILIEHASVLTTMVTTEGKVRLYYVDASKIPETVNCAESSDDRAFERRALSSVLLCRSRQPRYSRDATISRARFQLTASVSPKRAACSTTRDSLIPMCFGWAKSG
ncbi:MAG: hypothetical protein HY327_08240 [Chloroflexi bacterium]|nr:hypothetical protein [Chloroflexota bacterium]